jgi:hypothetical protein
MLPLSYFIYGLGSQGIIDDVLQRISHLILLLKENHLRMRLTPYLHR